MRRAGIFGVALLAAAGVASVALAGLSPKALRSSIVAAASAKHSVHYVTKQAIGNAFITLTGDVAATDGIQHVTITVGKQSGHLTIYVLDQTAYLQGDALGLQIQGLTKAQATQYADQWISIPKGDKAYGPTADYVTLPSVIQNITPHGRLVAAVGKVRGKRVVAVRGVSGTGKKKDYRIIQAPARGNRLPIEAEEVSPGRGLLAHTVLSKWNEAVSVEAPASSTPIATVRQS